MKRASIDIGSNTVLLLVGKFNENNLPMEELFNETHVTGLGKDLDKTGVFHPDSMEDTFEAMRDYKKKISSVGLEAKDTLVTATEAARVAKNSEEFFTRIKNELGFSISIINAEGEAFYTALGVTKAQGALLENLVIMDIGGASTELISIQAKPFKIIKTISLAVGSVRGTDWLKDDSFEKKMINLLENKDLDEFKTEHLLCVAGSMTSLAGMIKGLKKFDSNKVNGSVISFEKYLSFFDSIKGSSVSELEEKFPFLGKRAKSILAGALLGLKMGKRLKIKTFEISTYGLRYGTLYAGTIDKKYGKLR